MMNRRGFLSRLIIAPIVARFVPAVPSVASIQPTLAFHQHALALTMAPLDPDRGKLHIYDLRGYAKNFAAKTYSDVTR